MINDFMQKRVDKLEENLYEHGDVILKKLGEVIWDGLVVLTPEIVSVSALIIGGWVMINPMISNEPITKPLGIFAAIFAIGASIMTLSIKGG